VPEEANTRKYGRCEVRAVIGRGARSTVYRGWHEGLQIPVAVKVMPKELTEQDAQITERFLREARIAAQLNHPNIVRVYDCGETEDSYYLVLEYIEGKTCKDVIAEEGLFEWPAAVRIARQVAEGLLYAHNKGVIHRDLKPENIMIDKEGEARIADLGLAKDISVSQASATSDGDVLGTPYYMSPEQVKQPGNVDFRADIYSLGATLYHMVTGRVPFDASTPFEIMTKHLSAPLTPPEELNPDLPGQLSGVIVRAMAKEPQDRYQSYEALIQELDHLLMGGESEAAAQVEQMVSEPADEPGTLRQASIWTDERGVTLKLPEKEVVLPRPVRPDELTLTRGAIEAKALGLAALLAYALLLVCLHRVVMSFAPFATASVTTAALIAAAALWAYAVCHPAPGRVKTVSDESIKEQVEKALQVARERLSLRSEQVRFDRRADPACYAFGLRSGKFALHVPLPWLTRAYLSEREMVAYMTHAIASAYTGDSAIRTLLSAPLYVLVTVRAFSGRALEALTPEGGPRRVGFARVLVMVALGLVCLGAVGLFTLSVPAGLAYVGLLVTLALVAAFERATREAADEFTRQVLGDREVVEGVIIASGLTGLDGFALLQEVAGPEAEGEWSGSTAEPKIRERFLSRIRSYYAEVWHVPATLDLALKLFSTVPPAPERLNRLAGLTRPPSHLLKACRWLGGAYAQMVGLRERGPSRTVPADLAVLGPYLGFGTACGAAAVATVLVLYLKGAYAYPAFLGAVGLLSAALGVSVAAYCGSSGLTTGRLGWGVCAGGAAFAAVNALGFTLAGGTLLSGLALETPAVLGIALLVGGTAAALFVRLSAALWSGGGAKLAQSASDAGRQGDRPHPGGPAALELAETLPEPETPARVAGEPPADSLPERRASEAGPSREAGGKSAPSGRGTARPKAESYGDVPDTWAEEDEPD